jgi:hypothetical protein
MKEPTLIQPLVSLLLDDPADGLSHPLPLPIARHMHLALNRDVRVRNTRSEQLPQRTEHKRNTRGDLALLLHRVLHLLKQRVLQDGVQDQHERGDDAAEQGLRALLLHQGDQRRDGARVPLARGPGLPGALLLLEVPLACRHARVDDPDGVRQDHGGAAGEGARHHGLERRQLLVRPAGLGRRRLEERPAPLVPVVVDEVGHADAEDGAVEAGVQARDALARDDGPHGRQEGGLGSGGFDLGAGREGYQGIATERGGCCQILLRLAGGRWPVRYMRRDEGRNSRQYHGQYTTASACEGVRDIVVLWNDGFGSYRCHGCEQ